jgi:hypothetical protein
LKALLARKKQFEGLKSRFEYLGGAASPKEQFEGLKPCLKYLEGAAGPKETIRDNFDRKFPRRSKPSLLEEPHSKRSAKDRVIEKTLRMFGWHKREEHKNLERNPVKKSSECKGHIPLKLERILTSLYPLSRKESTYPKDCIIADDMLRRVVTPPSAGVA